MIKKKTIIEDELSNEKSLVKLYGKVTDFKGNALSGTDIKILSREFEPIYKTITNEEGLYELNVKPNIYASFFACKDYAVNNLEYWAWNLPLLDHMELNVKIDGLEVYAINAFQVQGATPNRIMLFFRPMSLKKSKPLKESGEIDALEIAPISPNLTKDHIHVIINEEKVKIYEINKVFEDRGDNKKLISYLIHVGLPKNLNKYEYNKITITLYDSETHERGEGSLFWKADEVI